MRLSELVGKEIINYYDGAKLGIVGESDVVINSASGEIHSIILPRRSNIFNLRSERLQLSIPWDCIRKIGTQVIIVELGIEDYNSRPYMR